MALTVTHSTAADGTFSASGATAWNANHSITGSVSIATEVSGLGTGVATALGVNTGTAGAFVVNGGALGTPSSGTLTNATGLPVGGISATGTPGATTYLRGDGTWSTVSASSTWDAIGAAAADGTTNNGVNRIVYNTAPTADSRIAWRFTESSAATNGTSTSGVPNQVLLKLDTLASSTQSPLSVYSRAGHVFSVSPSTRQILATGGADLAPSYAFAAAADAGMWYGGASTADLVITNGSFSNSAIKFLYSSGNYDIITFNVGASAGNTAENYRVFKDASANGVAQFSNAQATTTAYSINFRKSRGTVASPTVITTGDVLETKSAYAYVGATNTYRETSRYEVKSAGTISDATTGVGSIVTIYGKTQGTDVTPQPAVVITGGSTATFKFAGSGMVAANGTVATVLGSVGPTGANTTVQEWLKVDTPNGTRYIPCF